MIRQACLRICAVLAEFYCKHAKKKGRTWPAIYDSTKNLTSKLINNLHFILRKNTAFRLISAINYICQNRGFSNIGRATIANTAFRSPNVCPGKKPRLISMCIRIIYSRKKNIKYNKCLHKGFISLNHIGIASIL